MFRKGAELKTPYRLRYDEERPDSLRLRPIFPEADQSRLGRRVLERSKERWLRSFNCSVVRPASGSRPSGPVLCRQFTLNNLSIKSLRFVRVYCYFANYVA